MASTNRVAAQGPASCYSTCHVSPRPPHAPRRCHLCLLWRFSLSPLSPADAPCVRQNSSGNNRARDPVCFFRAARAAMHDWADTPPAGTPWLWPG
eukprot:scaffold2231_cov71-Phaeocystis_antarctica.AAC.2